MKSSKIKNILLISALVIACLAFAILVFAASTILFTIVCNYAAIDKTIFAGFPLYFFVAEIMTFGFYLFRKHFALRNICFHRRFYSIVLMIISSLGLVSSIVVGTAIYGTFLDYRIIQNYPLLMLITNIILLGFSIFVFISMNKKIKNEKLVNDYKMDIKHIFKTIGYVIIFWYAFDRLGAFLLMPIYYSTYDSAATIPYLIQCLVPLVLAIIAFVNKRYFNSSKFAVIAFSSVLAYSIFSLCFLLLAAKNLSNLILNSISLIEHFERLITIPIDLIMMYGISIILPIGYILHAIFVLPKKAKQKWMENDGRQ